MKKNDNKIFFLTSAVIILIVAPFFVLNAVKAQTKTSPDAIAIRIIPNPSHYSATLWYKNNNFKGSPQSLTVDGYEGVRDGRTVYVNVGNVDIANKLYTNIYLISYNQAAEQGTVDIFGKILQYWRFNSNITSAGKCRMDAKISCFMDDECAIGDFCDSTKSRIIRDVKRLSDFAEIADILKNYSPQDVYPALNSGSYLTNRTLSVWPSWSGSLGKELKISMPVDPINKIGACSSEYNQSTCWNEISKKFSEIWPKLPLNSLTYMYTGQSDGKKYDLCAVRETGYAISGEDYFSASCPKFCLDYDKDGYGSPGSSACKFLETDCNDSDSSVTVGFPEAGKCSDGIDNDCDGLTDCADPACFGDVGCSAPVCPDTKCEAPENCSTCPADCGACPSGPVCGNGVKEEGEQCDGGSLCDSSCMTITPSCTDNDGDYFISEATDITLCNSLSKPSCGPGKNELCIGNNDCDDSNTNVFPENTEICDGLDNNCSDSNHLDGVNSADIDEGWNAENCGYKCTGLGFNYNSSRSGNLRCCGNDSGEGNPLVSTYQSNEKTPTNLCNDKIDNDCNGKTDILDEACMPCLPTTFVNEAAWYMSGQPDCNQCDLAGSQDDDQNDADWESIKEGTTTWEDVCDSDCGTVSKTVSAKDFELGVETKCDGIDNNCNGQIDEGLGQITCGLGICNHTIEKCVSGVTQVCNPMEGEKTEICGNGIDEDCNGSDLACGPTCTDADGDRYIAEGTNFSLCGNVCGPAKNMACLGNNDCDDANKFRYPGNPETCDNLDNNCNGTIDEGCDDDLDGYCDQSSSIFYVNTVKTGLDVCPNSTADSSTWDCNDANIAVHPGAAEICDGVDNDCNALTFFNPDEVFYEGVKETLCSDTHDNDCDGLVDTADTVDCPSALGCNFPFTFPCTF
jgi:hypothetical protein